MEIWRKQEIVFEGKVVRLKVGNVELDDGSEAYREVVEHPGGVCVLPFTGDGFILVRQYRIALGKYLVEAPAGKLEVDETPRSCAVKELHEETGYRADTWVDLGTIHSSVGFCSESIHLFLAADLTEIGRKPEPEERIEMLSISMAEAKGMLTGHTLEDAKTAVLLQRALAWLKVNRAGCE